MRRLVAMLVGDADAAVDLALLAQRAISSEAMFHCRETLVFDSIHIGANGRCNVWLVIHEVFDKFGSMSGKDTQHVMHHQYLTRATGAGADANRGYP